MPRRLPTAFALSALVLLPALLRADDPPKGDKDLDGTWEMASIMQNGKDALTPPDKMLVTIKGGTVTVKIGDETHTATISVDASKTPKTLDLTFGDGPNKGKTAKAVYEIKGDELKICHGEPDAERPKELAAKEGSDLTLATLKRVKP
ncbi:MAG TPA: TIGR03067 domain-containing protein [Gemmataceae bacterium]|nr:TIGR03067 domain-containing protein [Gemmataceae bacterium]